MDENQTHSNSLLPTNEEDPFTNEGARVVTTDLPFVSLCRFFMMLKGS